MADTPVSPPTPVVPTAAPNRNTTTDPLTYSQVADAWAGSLPAYNAYLEDLGDNVAFNAESAFDSAAEAVDSAQSALDSETAAVAAANFLGEWSALTGALAPPASVRHEGRIWNLLVSIPDVTASEPGVSSDWAVLSQFYRITRTSNSIININDFGQIIDITSGTFTQTFDPAASLGEGFYCYVINSGSGIITLDPNASETINITSVYQGDILLILSDGSNLYAYLLNKDRSVNEIILTTGNGYGSTNTQIRRFSTAQKNTGNAMTYADSAANGASVTINQPGLYSISYYDSSASSALVGTLELGVSVNSSELTTQIDAITAANRVLYVAQITTDNSQANSAFGGGTTLRLEAGDVIRPHNGSVLPNSTAVAATKFSILKVA